MLKLKLQYFGHVMRRTDSLEKTLLLAKIEIFIIFLDYKLNTFKMLIFFKVIYRFKAINKNSSRDFIDIDKMILTCTKAKEINKKAKTILKKNKVGRLVLPDFKTY